MTRSLRVLIIDDCHDNSDILALLLQELDCEARIVNAAETAMKVADEFGPHLVLLDIAMPTVNRYQVARSFRRSATFKTVRLVAVSGYADQAHKDRAVEAGFDAYLVKPFSMSQLNEVIDRVRAGLESADLVQCP